MPVVIDRHGGGPSERASRSCDRAEMNVLMQTPITDGCVVLRVREDTSVEWKRFGFPGNNVDHFAEMIEAMVENTDMVRDDTGR